MLGGIRTKGPENRDTVQLLDSVGADRMCLVRRDVRRVETPAGASEVGHSESAKCWARTRSEQFHLQVRVHVVRDRGWRISDDHVAGVTEEAAL